MIPATLLPYSVWNASSSVNLVKRQSRKIFISSTFAQIQSMCKSSLDSKSNPDYSTIRDLEVFVEKYTLLFVFPTNPGSYGTLPRIGEGPGMGRLLPAVATPWIMPGIKTSVWKTVSQGLTWSQTLTTTGLGAFFRLTPGSSPIWRGEHNCLRSRGVCW